MRRYDEESKLGDERSERERERKRNRNDVHSGEWRT